jgi:alpha-L-fucosidase
MVPEVYERLAEIGKWMNINSEAIYNTKPLAPYQEDRLCFTQSKDGRTRYAIYLKPEDSTIPETVELPGHFAARSPEATLLGSPTPLKIDEKSGKYFVTLPAEFFTDTEQPAAIVIAVAKENN